MTSADIDSGQRIARMVADPELGGELLLIGTTMAAILDHGLAEHLSLKRIHILAYGPKGPRVRIDSDVRKHVPTRNGQAAWNECRTAELLRLDARRYQAPEARNIVIVDPREPVCQWPQRDTSGASSRTTSETRRGPENWRRSATRAHADRRQPIPHLAATGLDAAYTRRTAECSRDQQPTTRLTG